MDFYVLSTTGGTDLHLPVNPSEVTVESEKRIETVEVINIGEIDFPVGHKRAGIRFSSFFPAEYDSSYCQYPGIPSPLDALSITRDFKDAGKPVRLLITDSPINTLVIISRLEYRIVGGEPGDIYYDLELRTWREVKVRTAAEIQAASAAKTAAAPRANTKPVPKTYTVKPGDSLWKIAKLQLGSGAKWSEIYALNTKIIGKKPELIQPGQKLVMPA